nr:unnamed protein product [Digitaria exilis]
MAGGREGSGRRRGRGGGCGGGGDGGAYGVSTPAGLNRDNQAGTTEAGSPGRRRRRPGRRGCVDEWRQADGGGRRSSSSRTRMNGDDLEHTNEWNGGDSLRQAPSSRG